MRGGIPTRIDCPSDVKAEGMVGPFAYDTDIVSADGCAIHFWTMSDAKPDRDTLEAIKAALRCMKNERDIVAASFSNGRPAGFWTRMDVPMPGYSA